MIGIQIGFDPFSFPLMVAIVIMAAIDLFWSRHRRIGTEDGEMANRQASR
jgi:hypothetical protein